MEFYVLKYKLKKYLSLMNMHPSPVIFYLQLKIIILMTNSTIIMIPSKKFSYTLLNSSLYDSIIKTIGKYIPNINENSFLLSIYLMETEVPSTESATQILVT